MEIYSMLKEKKEENKYIYMYISDNCKCSYFVDHELILHLIVDKKKHKKEASTFSRHCPSK